MDERNLGISWWIDAECCVFDHWDRVTNNYPRRGGQVEKVSEGGVGDGTAK